MTGCVYLVGAGPGDPRLLTVRAHELVRAADVLAHDELVSPAILALAPPDAELIPVGRRAGHGPTSYRLHPAVLERARAGRDVVRLKCGDPLVFGRGGEEAAELTGHGIAFELVPGVSAALGAAAYAGIPLTHRACASSVRLATGHNAEGRSGPTGETLVVYMAARRVASTMTELARAGWSTATPAAWIAAATTPAQRVIVGTVADLAARVAAADAGADGDVSPPALLVVGEVVAHRTPWWELRPLVGRRILVARARPGRSRIAAGLRALGAEVIEAPTVELAPLPDAALDAVLDALDGADVIGFGCAAGVELILGRRAVAADRIVAIGAGAATALARRGVVPALALDGACGAALAPAAAALRGRRLIAITATAGRPALLDELAGLGVTCEALAAYRTVTRLARLPPIDVVALPSSSAARLVLVDPDLRARPVVAIGAHTAAIARALGAQRVALARTDTIEALIDRVVETAREVA